MYRFEVPGNNRDILAKISELKVLRTNIEKHIKVLQTAHDHSDIESSGDPREFWRYCKDCGANL